MSKNAQQKPSSHKDSEEYKQMVAERYAELFCDACGHYPIEPVHGHFVCPQCKMPTKCCEGLPQ